MQYNLKKMEEADLNKQTVLVRVDFNVAISNKKIMNTKRIDSTIPTINYLESKNCRIILVSHLGRPRGVDMNLSLQPVRDYLSEKLNKEVYFIKNIESINETVNRMNYGDVAIMENIRFYNEETKNSEKFSKMLASSASVFVSDAFGTLHRAHSSTVGVSQYLPSYAGLLVEKEVCEISKLLDNPSHPYTVALGGAKVSDKIKLIQNLSKNTDRFVIGGAMANSFIRAMGFETGKSLVDSVGLAKQLLDSMDNKLILPVDVIVCNESMDRETIRNAKIDDIKINETAMDIGNETTAMFRDLIKESRTVIFNGPMGYVENESFENGTKAVMDAIGSVNGVRVAGGGDTLSAIEKFHMENRFSYISTGGGAFLELLEGSELPGLKVLLK